MRPVSVLALGTVAALALLTTAVSVRSVAAAGEPHVSVYFVQGEQLAPITRPGTTARDALRQLIAGPTRAERRRGFRTYVPPRTRVRSVTVKNGTATS